nr:EamA family transporter RarD [Schaalia sp. 19OD2882]
MSTLLAISTHLMWGFFPLYFALLTPAGALEVIVHRAVWGLACCLLALALTRRLPHLRAALRDRALAGRLSLAGFLVVINWTVYVHAIQSGHTVDAALGYFINPLFTVALALVVRRERISWWQKVALALGVVAVVVLVVGLGRLPWVALALAGAFGLYSLVKKGVATRVGPIEGMAIETGAVTPVLLAYFAYLVATDSTSFQTLTSGAPGPSWPAHLALLIGAGALTVFVLAIFAKAAQGLPLGMLGFIQYISPTMQLLIGVLVFREHMEPVRWIATGIVWLALGCLSIDGLIAIGRAQRLRARAA